MNGIKTPTFNRRLKTCNFENGINSSLTEFPGLISSVTDDLFKSIVPSGGSRNGHTTFQNAWFTKECGVKEKWVLWFLNSYRDNASDGNRLLLLKLKTDYKSTLRKSRRNYTNVKTKVLESNKYSNAKLLATFKTVS